MCMLGSVAATGTQRRHEGMPAFHMHNQRRVRQPGRPRLPKPLAHQASEQPWAGALLTCVCDEHDMLVP